MTSLKTSCISIMTSQLFEKRPSDMSGPVKNVLEPNHVESGLSVNAVQTSRQTKKTKMKCGFEHTTRQCAKPDGHPDGRPWRRDRLASLYAYSLVFCFEKTRIGLVCNMGWYMKLLSKMQTSPGLVWFEPKTRHVVTFWRSPICRQFEASQ